MPARSMDHLISARGPGDPRVVDVDVHIDDTPAALAPYCAMPWRKSLEMLAASPQRYLDIPGFAPNVSVYPPIPGGHANRSVHTPRELREGLDLLGIDDAIMLPDHLLLFATLPHVEWATELSHAYNRWLVAEWVKPEEGLYGAIMACPQNPRDSAREIGAHAGATGVVAVYLPTAGLNPLWGHRLYDPILGAAEAAGLPVILHSVSILSPVFPANMEQFENNFAKQVIGHSFSMMANMISLVHSGVPVRFPNLKIVYTESGISWVPSMMWRMDRRYDEFRRLVPFLEARPSDYVRRQMWFSTQPLEEPDPPSQLVETMLHVGTDRILFASDWPHHDFDHPGAVLRLPLTPEQRRGVMGGNAVELFRLPALTRQPA
jgi:predicted TIM-barrel fold metal-dependent hydrolase